MKHLADHGTVQGLDVDEYAVDICRCKGLDCSVGDMNDLHLPADRYDLITFFDVLYQAPKELMPDILGRVYDSLSEDGLLSMREPALKIAGGRHDKEVNGQERFDKRSMASLLSGAGFKVRYIGYINFLLFFPIVLKRKMDILMDDSPRSDLKSHSSIGNFAFLTVLRLENRILKMTRVPFGVSLFAVAQKIRD